MEMGCVLCDTGRILE